MTQQDAILCVPGGDRTTSFRSLTNSPRYRKCTKAGCYFNTNPSVSVSFRPRLSRVARTTNEVEHIK